MRHKIAAWDRREDLFIVPTGGWVLMAVVLLSVILAGGRPIWAQGVVALGIGILWIIWPPSKLPSKPVTFVLLALAVAPLAAYLPGQWLAMPEWRGNLHQYPALRESGLVTLQPWLTFHVWLLWLCGLALAAWCACQNWDHYHRGTLARIHAGGMLIITIFAIFGFLTGFQPSWWQSTDGFGPFLNRNQWGSALGFAGVVALALIHQCLRQKHFQGALFWALAMAVFAGAVVQNGSRGGVVVLVVGGFTYWSFFGILKNQYRYAALAISFLCLSLAIFAIGGGELLERFIGMRSMLDSGLGGDARYQFYLMTSAMVRDAPFTGFGLGNFEYTLPFYLHYEPLFDRRPIHPESSWLWLLSEGGWLLVLVVLAALVVLVQQGYLARRSRAATIRSAGLTCAVLLAVNSFFEVSGHRIGTLFPVIVLSTLALPAAKWLDLPKILHGLTRAVGIFLALVGLLWILAGLGVPLFPTAQGIQGLQARAESENQSGRREEAIGLLEQGKNLSPLDWNVHWSLSDWLLEDGKIEPAWEEFRAASALLPYMYWTIEQQAAKWIQASPAKAATAMMDAISRAPSEKRVEMYSSFLRRSSENLALHSALLRFFPDNAGYEFVRIQLASPEIALKRLGQFLKRTNNLALAPDSLIEPVFRFMLHRGQEETLDQIVAGNPRLKKLGWEVLMIREARRGRHKEALDLYFNNGPRPALPAPLSRSDLRSVERAAALAPLDIATAIAYYQALVAAHRDGDAFWQLRRVMDSPLAPPYIWYLAAQTSHSRGEYEEGWNFLETYIKKPKQ